MKGTVIIIMGILILTSTFLSTNNSNTTASEKVIFAMDDYLGDDDGPGGYLYPTDPAYKDGVFDLLYFFVEDLGVKLRFVFMFYELDDNPWNGPYGFSTEFIQVYIDSIPAEGSTETWNAKVCISPLDAWDVALLIGPGLRAEHNRIWYGGVSGGTYIDGVMNIYINESLSAIVAEVLKAYLPSIENLDEWRYVVLVLGVDPESSTGVISVAPGKPKARAFGSGDLHVDAAARNIAPQVIDALYPDPDIQYELLSSYTLSPPKYATVTAVPSTPSISIITKTRTMTRTRTITFTKRETTTETMIKTETKTIMTTLTETSIITNVTTVTKTKYIQPLIKTTTITETNTLRETIYSTTYLPGTTITLTSTKVITSTSILTTSVSKPLVMEIQNLLILIIIICILTLVIIFLRKSR